jgi:hypothetical protein
MPQDRDLHILRDTGSEAATEDIQEATGKQIDEAAQHRPTLLDTTRDRLMTPFTRSSQRSSSFQSARARKPRSTRPDEFSAPTRYDTPVRLRPIAVDRTTAMKSAAPLNTSLIHVATPAI